MWHEARRQERKIRGMLVDYRKRAERRRDFYEKIKADPTQFLQVHGRQCKIHLDPQVAAAADSAVMMPWQGNSDTLIDRFDGRAHLDYIPPLKKEEEVELSQEERQLNYERYRIIAQNAFLGITEEKFLKQLQLEEQFGYTEHHQKGKKEQKSGGAAIGFNYDEGTGIAQVPDQPDSDHNTAGDSDSDADCSDLDVDLSVNVSKMDAAQAHEMNKHGRQFGMHSNDFYSFLTDDMEEAENRRMAREEEQEKALYAGRKSRRERRYHREKRLANRVLSPPSYAARESPTLVTSLRESKSASRSPSPENTGKITFITSFGGEDETPSGSKPTYADKVKQSAAVKAKSRSAERTVYRRRSRSDSRRRKSRSGSRIRSRKSRSRSVSRGKRARRSRSPPLRRRSRSVSSRSRSRSASVVKRKSRSRSYSRDRKLHSKPYFRAGGVSNTSRTYKRQRRGSSDSSTSSSSSSRARSPLKRKSYSASPTKETSNKSRQSQDQEDTKMEVDEPPKVLPRYYGRKRSDESSSEDDDEEHAEEHQDNGDTQKAQSVKSDNSEMGHGNSSGIGTKRSSTNMTIIERLKRKRQALLNRQFKADKIAEQLKTEREKQEQQTREDELRMMAIKLRRKQRERRHANDSRSNSSSDSDEGSRRSKSSDSSGKKRPSSPPREKERERSDERENRSARHRTDYRGRSRSRERSRERDRRGRRDSRDRRDSKDSRVSRDRRDSRDRNNSGKDKRSSSPRRLYRDRGREDKDRERGPPKRSLVDY